MAERLARPPAGSSGPAGADPGELPIGELLKRASEQTSRLVREELRLAQLEMQQKAKHAGIGAGLLGAAGIVALFGVAVLIACIVLALATAMDAWLAALIVALVLLAAAGGMALAGKQEVAEAAPAKPERAIDSVQDDIGEIKARSAR
ncbi:MAG: phage holin family protein [Solirubrobacteraceae bacterium]|nr:phage holin family protein [Solirubrobacteraceae bacterium]